MCDYTTSSDIDDTILEFSNLKVSALRNAALISPYVKTVTLGPKAENGYKELRVTLTKVENSDRKLENQNISIKSRLGPKVLDESNEFTKSSNSLSWNPPKENLTLGMASYHLQQERKECVRRDLKSLLKRFSESDRILKEKMAIEKQEATERLESRVRDSEREILKDLEIQQRQAALWEKRKNEEYKENLRRIKERQILLRQEEELRIQQKKEMSRKRQQVESIFINYKIFKNHYQECIEVMKNFDDRALVQRIISERSLSIKQLSNAFEEVIVNCKTGTQTDEDVEVSQSLTLQIEQLCTKMIHEYTETIEKYKIEQEEELMQKEELKQKELELKKFMQEKLESSSINQSKLLTVQKTVIDGNVSNTGFGIGSIDNWKLFAEYKCFHEEYIKNFEELKQDTNMKKFRFECQKAVNIPVNAIGNNSTQHLQDKLRKLEGLLSGQPVPAGDVSISAAQHPQGIAFCTDLVARKLVKQGSLVAINPQSAFPLATVIISLWKKFPNFGKLLLAYFYQECPYLVPVYPRKEPDMKDLEYYRLIGYEINSDGSMETDHSYLQRMSGMGRLFFAVMITPCKDEQHPFGLGNAWTWLAYMLNSDPQRDISATLVLQCLEITGNRQLKVYKTMFNNMLKAIANQYMPVLAQVDDGGPQVRLQQFLKDIIDSGTIENPIQSMPSY